MISNLKFLFSILEKKQKNRFFLLLFSMIFAGLFEILNILFLVEFISFLSTENNSGYFGFFKTLFQFFNFNYDLLDVKTLILLLIPLICLSALANLYSIYLTSKFSLKTGGEIESNLFNYYLERDYAFHLNSSSSKLMNNIFELVKRISSFVLAPLMIVTSKLVFVVPLIVGLLIFKTSITFFSIIVFIILYLIFFKTFKKKMSDLGKTESIITEKKFSVLQNGIGGIREVKLYNKFDFFRNAYDRLYNSLVNIEIQRDLIGKTPRYFFEVLTIISALFLILYLNKNLNYDFNEIIVNISFFIICAYKIIPAFQTIYYHISIIKNHLPAVENLSDDLLNMKKSKNQNLAYMKIGESNNFESLEVKNLDFAYEKNFPIVKNINFKINKGDKIAITGPSGSGKSTLIHLLLGLIKANRGEILINNKTLENKNLRSWQNKLGFVPQSIFLTNESVKENVAFGVSKEEIENNKVDKLLKISILEEKINTLPDKLNSIIGDRGVKFSGGQQQRIGLARALYHNPEVVILDEATNALDLATENEILNSLLNLGRKITIIMIAHRLDILKKFDKIIFLEKGKLTGLGTFKELFNENLAFRKLVNQSNNIY